MALRLPWGKLVLAAACIGGVRWGLRMPQRPVPEPLRDSVSSSSASPATAVMNAWLPACGGTISQMSGAFPEVSDPGNGSTRLRWISAGFRGGNEMVAEYDPRWSLLKPLNQAAKDLLDARYSCKQRN